MIVTRRNKRIELMQALYQYDLYQSDKLEFNAIFENEDNTLTYNEIVEQIRKIDQIIETHLYEYSLYRLAFLDRAIIRLAVYELISSDLAKQIIIDEAIELTKIYSNLDDGKQHRFTNKVLDNIAKTIRG